MAPEDDSNQVELLFVESLLIAPIPIDAVLMIIRVSMIINGGIDMYFLPFICLKYLCVICIQ
jgi:hypothetical protein